MVKLPRVEVTLSKDGWIVYGAGLDGRVFQTKEEAVAKAKAIAKRRFALLFVDGKRIRIYHSAPGQSSLSQAKIRAAIQSLGM